MLTEHEAEEFRIRRLVETWAVARELRGLGDIRRGVARRRLDDRHLVPPGRPPTSSGVARPDSRRGVNSCTSWSVCTLSATTGSATTGARGRAIAQTKMGSVQRADVHGVTADVDLHRPVLRLPGQAGRPLGHRPAAADLREGPARPGEPGGPADLDPKLLGSFQAGYRHLAYLQFQLGYQIAPGLPGLRGPAVDVLYQEGRDWLDGSPRPGVPTADSLRSPGSHGVARLRGR